MQHLCQGKKTDSRNMRESTSVCWHLKWPVGGITVVTAEVRLARVVGITAAAKLVAQNKKRGSAIADESARKALGGP